MTICMNERQMTTCMSKSYKTNILDNIEPGHIQSTQVTGEIPTKYFFKEKLQQQHAIKNLTAKTILTTNLF